MIELLAQFAAREDGVLVSIDELNRIVRAGTHAQLAEKAAAQIVFVTVEYLAGLTRLLVGHLLGDDIDRSVGTVHLADAAGNATMLVLVVVDHDQLAAEAVRNLQRGTIFGVLLRRLAPEKDLDRGAHTHQQGAQAAEK